MRTKKKTGDFQWQTLNENDFVVCLIIGEKTVKNMKKKLMTDIPKRRPDQLKRLSFIAIKLIYLDRRLFAGNHSHVCSLLYNQNNQVKSPRGQSMDVHFHSL